MTPSENPYASPKHTDFTATPAALVIDDRPGHYLLKSYLGTTISGALFGIIGGPVGIVAGGILAGMTGFFVYLLAYIGGVGVTTRRGFIRLGGLCGAATGFFSVCGLAGFDVDAAVLGLACAAALVGTAGGIFGAATVGPMQG